MCEGVGVPALVWVCACVYASLCVASARVDVCVCVRV